MRTIPGMQVIAPCDAYEATKALECAVNSKQPTYIRLYGGTAIPAVFAEETEFECGKAIKLRDGNDIQIIATGSMVGNAMKVAEALSAEGTEAEVLDMHTIKPLDADAIDYEKKMIVTLEEHNVIGGLGSAVSEVLSRHTNHPKQLTLGINDRFLPVGNYQYLLQQAGLDGDSIKNEIINNIK